MNRSDYPALYLAASDASRDEQNTYKRSVKTDLSLVVTGAVLGALAFLVHEAYTAAFAAVAAIVLLGSIVTKFVAKQRGDDKEWFDGRAVAESVKTLTWRYMMRLEPFDNDATSDQKFFEEVEAIRKARSGLQLRVGALGQDTEQITPHMREVRLQPVEKRRALYVKERLDEQAGWYAVNAEANRRLANRMFWASLTAQVVALVLAVWRVAFPFAGLSLVGPLLAPRSQVVRVSEETAPMACSASPRNPKVSTRARSSAVRILLIGCAGSANPSFAGIFRIQQARTNRFDTNLTPTRSIYAGPLM